MIQDEILILGAGVSGLSTGILLLQAGCNVRIWAKELPPHTTSNKAAAVWFPYLCLPREKAIRWAKTTFEYLQEKVLDDPQSGCTIKTIIEIFDKPQPEPWWKEGFPGTIERPTQEELPNGYVDGYRIKTIVIDTTLYMNYLMNIFLQLHGQIIQKEISEIEEAFGEHSIVINCTGLGSRKLFNDEKVYPVRGQMVKIKPTGLDEIIADDEGPNNLSLIIPRVNDIMLGGTAQVNDWNLEVDPKDTEEILRKAKRLVPNMNIEVISESVGLRPVRNSVRLESEKRGDKTIIHNYGHGGAGFTLSWGCAQDVVEIIKKL